MSKLKESLKQPTTWVIIGVVVIATLAFASKIPAIVKKVAQMIPGSDKPASA